MMRYGERAIPLLPPYLRAALVPGLIGTYVLAIDGRPVYIGGVTPICSVD